MKIAVINYSGPGPKADGYNLAAEKMLIYFAQQGHDVYYSTRADMWTELCDEIYITCIFTYDLPALKEDVLKFKAWGMPVHAGGPAITAMATYPSEIMKETKDILSNAGVKIHIGLDERFEHIDGKFKYTFTSRGCPRNCDFCIVSTLEGRKMIEYENFNIPVGKNPYVCDNNILSTSWSHQKMVVEKLEHLRNLDINSGFDDRIFAKNPEKYWRLYNELNLECWRFAYDSEDQREPIKYCTNFLHSKGVDYRRIIVFCLVGWPGMSVDDCVERLQYLKDLETSPYPMRYRPLDAIEKHVVPDGWQEDDMIKIFAYWGVPYIWKSDTWENFRWPRK